IGEISSITFFSTPTSVKQPRSSIVFATMFFSRKNILAYCLLAARAAISCETGSFVPESGSNALYYVDTTSYLPLAIYTYWFGTYWNLGYCTRQNCGLTLSFDSIGSDCVGPIDGRLIDPNGVVSTCFGTETGDNTVSPYYW